MVKIEHNLTFVTEVDETHPTAMRLLQLPDEMQITFLEGMLKEMIAPRIQPALDEVNEGNTWALLKVAE